MEWPDLDDEDVFGGTCEDPSFTYRSRSGPVRISRTGASPYRAMSYSSEVNQSTLASRNAVGKASGSGDDAKQVKGGRLERNESIADQASEGHE